MTFAMMMGQWVSQSKVNSEDTVDMIIAAMNQLSLQEIKTLRNHMK